MKSIVFILYFFVAVFSQAQNFSHTPLELAVADKTTKAVLTIPTGEGPFPAMIIIAGSGATDLEGNSAGLPGKNNSLRLLAEDLATKGYASLRYNKRIFAGFGEQNLRFDDFVTDALSAFKLLKADPRVSSVGIAGHSQGSLVGMIAAQQVAADFYISLAGSGKSFDAIISDQLRANPANPKDLIEKAESIMASLKSGETASDIPPVLLSLFRPTVQAFIGSWMKYDPAVEIAKVTIPMLIINGTTDIQVGEENAKLLMDAAIAAKELLIIEGMNHVFKDAPADRNGNLAAYSNPDLPLASGLVEGIDTYLKKTLRK